MNRLMKRRGFTLIELLVVIAIIGILAALIIVSLSGARSKAQDTQRKNNARNLNTALEQYATEHNATYPVDGMIITAATGVSLATACGTSGVLTNTLIGSDKYMNANGACNDPSTNERLYNTNSTTLAGSTTTDYAITWLLGSQSEAVVTAGNGVYQASSSSVSVPFVSGSFLATVGATNSKYFVVFGPQ